MMRTEHRGSSEPRRLLLYANLVRICQLFLATAPLCFRSQADIDVAIEIVIRELVNALF